MAIKNSTAGWRVVSLILPISMGLFAAAWSGPATPRPTPAVGASPHHEKTIADLKDRSPLDLALTSDGRYALTTNSGADTVSLVDLQQGRVEAEVRVGKRPFGIAVSRDGRRAAVTNLNSNSLTLLEVSPPELHVIRTIPVGDAPRGVALSSNGRAAWTAVSGEDCVVCVDLNTGKTLRRVEVGVEPWQVALNREGSLLAVGNARSMDMSVIDVAAGQVDHTVRNLGHNLRHIALSPDGQWAYTPHIAERLRPATKESIDRGWIIGNRLSRCPLQAAGPRESLALDTEGEAVGDVDGVALSPSGDEIALTAGGTHELLLLHLPLPFTAYGGPADLIEPELLNRPERFRRVRLGGRPMGAVFTPDGGSVVTVDYLQNAVLQVDAKTGALIRTIPLGFASSVSLARRGEAIFLDAERSYHHWYSCNSCHVEGHTNGSNFDTFNDGSYGTPKKTLSLRGVTRTGPWTWHGWQKDLRELVHASLIRTMQGPRPTEEDLDALIAYLGTLEFRPSPYRNPDGTLTPSAQRGQRIFTAKGCNTCHAPPDYTTPAVYRVGLETPQDVYQGFNPPALRDVYSRAPYLHLGQAQTLHEVLTKYHRSSKLTGKPDPTPDELNDLIAFLRSL